MTAVCIRNDDANVSLDHVDGKIYHLTIKDGDHEVKLEAKANFNARNIKLSVVGETQIKYIDQTTMRMVADKFMDQGEAAYFPILSNLIVVDDDYDEKEMDKKFASLNNQQTTQLQLTNEVSE